MARHTQAKAHLTPEEIQAKIKSTVAFWRVQKWQLILNAVIASPCG